MVEYRLSDLHFQYADVIQHWHCDSQPHAGGDALLTALYSGWQVGETVLQEDHWFAGMRYVAVYHFALTRGGETMIMPVINNPYVTRFVGQSSLRVRPFDESLRSETEAQPKE